MKYNGTIANRKVHRDTIPGIEVFGNAVIYKEQVDFVIGVEGDPIRGCVTV